MTSRTLLRLSLPAACAALALAAVPAAQGGGGFRSGDLYLYTPTYTGLGTGDGAILRIDPLSGAVAQLVDLDGSPSNQGVMAYDSWRDRLLFVGTPAGGAFDLHALDAAGATQALGLGGGVQLQTLTPRGDGLVYLVEKQGGTFGFLDQADQLHVLTGPGGAPWSIGVSVANVRAMHYDAPANALVVATTSNVATCPGGMSDALNLRRLDLSADGTTVLAETCFQYDVNPGTGNEVPVGLTRGPEGDLLLTAQGAALTGLPFLARVDVAGAQATPYASPAHPAAWAMAAGAHSQVRDQAIVADIASQGLRAFAAGQGGAGDLLATGVGQGGVSTTLVEIGFATPHWGLTTDVGAISLAAGGTQPFELDLGPGHAGEISLVLGSLSGFHPGTPAPGGAYLLPLNVDAWFLYTLTHPGSGVLPGSLGILDAAGRASAALFIPGGLADPSLAGTTAHHAAVALNAGLGVEATTNAVPLELLP